MPNPVAYFALLFWIPLGIGLFAIFDARVAALGCLVGGMLILPVRLQIDVPLLPLNKNTIPMLCVLVGSVLFARGRFFARRRGFLWESLIGVLVIGVFLTGAFNRDALFYGPLTIKGLDLHDDIAFAIRLFLDWGLPFLLGLRLFRTPADLTIPLRALVVGAVLYIPFVLFELRMSPQLHYLVYGIAPHQFLQAIRYGGYRPIVFMGHGLVLAFFLTSATAAAMTLSRVRIRIFGYRCGPLGAALLVVLVLCKSMAAIIYGATASAAILLLKPRAQLRVAAVALAIVIAYPLLRSRDLFPTETLVGWADSASGDRAESLGFRFWNEDLLLARARERLLFGWGSWGRSRVHDEETGRDLAVTDGMWVIILGNQGVVGFVAVYGLLLGPVFGAALRLRRVRSAKDQCLITGTALIVTLAGIDTIPNVTSPFFFFLAGAVAGVVGDARTTIPHRASSKRRGIPAVESRLPSQKPQEAERMGGISVQQGTGRPASGAAS